MNENKHLFLEAEHIKLGGRMVPFGGWLMPVQYTKGILKEHHHTRNKVSLFDISHMGEFRVKGRNSAKELEHILARPVENMKIGTCRYNFLMNKNAGVNDDLIVYRIATNHFFIVVNASTTQADAQYIKSYLSSSISFNDESTNTGKLDLQGPLSADVLNSIGIKKESLPRYFNFIKRKIDNIDCLLSRTGYTGELGFEIYVQRDSLRKIWDILISHDEVEPAGLGCRDTLRLEMGYPLYGHELDESTTPIEAGFDALIKLDSHSFCGADVLINTAPKKHLTALILEGRRAGRQGTLVFDSNENCCGKVTSGSFSPSLQKSIALAYIDKALVSKEKLKLKVGNKFLNASVTTLPFYKNGTARKKI